MLRTTLRRLEVFVAVVEAGGFRACSDVLGISQAAVSSQIKQLEIEIGDKVFVRRSGTVGGLTDSGVSAYREAKDLLQHANLLGRLNGLKSRQRPKRLVIGADSVLDAQLARYITRFIADRTDLDIVLKRSHFEEMVDGINSNRVDIAYFYSTGPVSEVRSDLAWHEPFSICAHQSHPIFSNGPLTFSDLGKYPFVAAPKGTHFRRCVDQVLREHGVGQYPVSLEASHANIAREAVISGLAISAVIARYLDDEMMRCGVREVQIDGPSLTLDVRRAMRRELMLDDTALALTHYIEANMRPSTHRLVKGASTSPEALPAAT